MEWKGEGLLIGVRRHGETSVIAEALVHGKGRHLGLVRGGRSPKQSATLQPGNTVQLSWRARLEDHLGTFTVELLQGRAANLIADRTKLFAGHLICEHLRLLPERDPHDRLLDVALDMLDHDVNGVSLARFEILLLEELGFGLDLSSCAATGSTSDLTHVSPKSGRAVSRAAAEPYKERLLNLPAFLRDDAALEPDDLRSAFALSGYFLDMHVWHPRQLQPPPMREALVGMLAAQG